MTKEYYFITPPGYGADLHHAIGLMSGVLVFETMTDAVNAIKMLCPDKSVSHKIHCVEIDIKTKDFIDL